jgi:hypothetical protein
LSLWAWQDGKRLVPWTERRVPPYTPETAGLTITYQQFALFPKRRDAREWARAKNITRGRPKKLSLRSLRSLL